MTPEWRCASTARPLSAPKSNARYGLVAELLGITGNTLRVAYGAFLGDALEISALLKSFHRIFGQSFGVPPCFDCGANIGRDGILQEGLSLHQMAALLSLIMMTCIHQYACLWTCVSCQEESHTPVANVGVVEGGLERLVLYQQALSGRQLVVGDAEALLEPLLPLPNVGRAGVVRAVGKPHRYVDTLQATRNLDAVASMFESPVADGRVGIAE